MIAPGWHQPDAGQRRRVVEDELGVYASARRSAFQASAATFSNTSGICPSSAGSRAMAGRRACGPTRTMVAMAARAAREVGAGGRSLDGAQLEMASARAGASRRTAAARSPPRACPSSRRARCTPARRSWRPWRKQKAPARTARASREVRRSQRQPALLRTSVLDGDQERGRGPGHGCRA